MIPANYLSRISASCLLCLGLFCLSSTDAFAQTAPVKQWDKTFGSTTMDLFTTLQQTTDGGYILGGFSDSGISGDKTQPSKGLTDYWIVKLDANGNKTWDKSFGGSGSDALLSLQQTTDGGYILGGFSDSGVSGDKTQPSKGLIDYWVVKLDANGNKSWDKTFGGSDYDHLFSLQQTADGGYILGGISFSNISGDKSQANNGDYDFWIVKLNANGNKVWDKTFGGIYPDDLASIKQTADGGYIVGGDKTQVGGHDGSWVLKLDANGNLTWEKTLGGSYFDGIKAVQQTADGGYILGGSSNSGISPTKTAVNKGVLDFWLVKLDANGNKSWDKTFGGSYDDNLYALQQTSDGGYILGGESKSNISGDKTQPSVGDFDYWVVKTDAAGNKIWDKTIGGSSIEQCLSLQQTTDGGYILGGWSASGINGDKTSPNKGLRDYWILKLGASSTGIKETEASSSLSVFPNPSNDKFNLQLSNLTTPTAQVTVSDLLGRVVLQKQIPVTNNQLSAELTLPVAKGLYLLQLKAGKQMLTRKIVLE